MLAGLGVKAESTTYRVGRPLKFDPQTEKVTVHRGLSPLHTAEKTARAADP